MLEPPSHMRGTSRTRKILNLVLDSVLNQSKIHLQQDVKRGPENLSEDTVGTLMLSHVLTAMRRDDTPRSF